MSVTTAATQARPYAGDSDTAAVCELLNLCDAHDRLDDNYDVEDLRLEFSHPELDQARDLRLWEDEQGRLVGFGQMWLPRPDAGAAELDGYLYFRVHPEARGALDDEILAWGGRRLREAAHEQGRAPVLRTAEVEHFEQRHATLRRHGFALVRYFYRMARDLRAPLAEPQLPADLTLRHVTGEEDLAGWVAAFNGSFVDHYNFHPTTVESHRHWLQDPNYRPEHDLIAVAADGSVAAFCYCIVDQGANRRNGVSEGWIAMLGVRRGDRGRGLGRAMLLAGMRRLRDDGLAVAKLGVDAENPTGALRLYESVGFTRAMTRFTYARALADEEE